MYESNKDILQFKNTLIQHFKVLVDDGFCPTYKMIKDAGISADIIYNKFGGMKKVYAILDLKPICGFLTRDKHYVRSYYEFILDEYLYSRGIFHQPEILILPNFNYRCDQKVDDYYVEIWGLVGNADYDNRRRLKEKLYIDNNLKLISIESNLFRLCFRKIELYFDNIFSKLGYDVSLKFSFCINELVEQMGSVWGENAVKLQIQKYVDEHGIFPTQSMLRKNLSWLSRRIQQFGGFVYFRKLMDYSLYKKKNKWDEEVILNEIKSIFLNTGKFPKLKELSISLQVAINRCKGLNYYKNLLGVNINNTRRHDDTSLIVWLENIIEINGFIPKQKELAKINSKFLSAIVHRGGIRKFIPKISLKFSNACNDFLKRNGGKNK